MRRRALAVGGALKLIRGKMEESQNIKASEWEKKGVFGKIGAWVIESSGRKMKKAETWQDAAKYQAEIVEETYGLGDSFVSQLKLDTAVRAEQLEHVAKSGKDLKFAKKEQEIEDRIHHAVEEGRLDELSFEDQQFYKRNNKIFENKAAAANIHETMELSSIEREAEAKAKKFEEQGEYLKADAERKKADNAKFEKIQEPYKNLNFTERLAQEENLIQKITEKTDPVEIKNLQRQRVALAASNSLDSNEMSRTSRMHALQNIILRDKDGKPILDKNKKTISFLDKEGGLNDDNRFRGELSRQLGRYVEKGKENEAIAEWNSLFNNDKERQAALRGLAGAYKKSAMEGDMSGLGLIKEEIKDGKVVLKWEVDNSPDFTKYFAERAQKVDKITSMGNMSKDGRLDGFSERGAAAVAAFYSGKSNQNISALGGSVHASWNEANVTKENVASYVEALAKMQSGMNKQAFETQLGYTNVFVKKMADNIEGVTGDLRQKLEEFMRAANVSQESIANAVKKEAGQVGEEAEKAVEEIKKEARKGRPSTGFRPKRK
jgi:hypothetical protein